MSSAVTDKVARLLAARHCPAMKKNAARAKLLSPHELSSLVRADDARAPTGDVLWSSRAARFSLQRQPIRGSSCHARSVICECQSNKFVQQKTHSGPFHTFLTVLTVRYLCRQVLAGGLSSSCASSTHSSLRTHFRPPRARDLSKYVVSATCSTQSKSRVRRTRPIVLMSRAPQISASTRSCESCVPSTSPELSLAHEVISATNIKMRYGTTIRFFHLHMSSGRCAKSLRKPLRAVREKTCRRQLT